MKKKAQNASQVFIYILSIIIVGVILLFGYQAINTLIKNMNKVGMVDFQKNLDSSIRKATSDYGAVKKYEFTIGGEYKQICFIRNSQPLPGTTDYNATFNGYPSIRSEAQSQTGNNIFLIKNPSQPPEKFSIGKIETVDSDGFNCTNIKNGIISLRIEGKGDHVLIS